MMEKVLWIGAGALVTIVAGAIGVVAYVLWFIHKHGYDGMSGWEKK